MNVEIRMPKLGYSEGKVTLKKWLKQKGEPVEIGDAIAEVEGEKITNEIEADQKGILERQCVAEGSEVSIGDMIAVLEV